MPPVVSVVEIKETNMQELADLGFNLTSFIASEGPKGHLGGSADEKLTMLLQAYAAKSTTLFLLDWKGSKTPRGAVIRGHVVAWAQNGVVNAEGGHMIGTYVRLVEFGPQDHQQMVVYYIGKRA